MDSATANHSKSSEHFVLKAGIEENVKAELKNFICLSRVGQFKHAHELFDEYLWSHDAWYPVAAQYADCLLRQGDFEQLEDYSEKALTKFQDPKERALLGLMHLIGSRSPEDVMWRGFQSIWPGPPYTSRRDTDIHLLEVILQILVLTKRLPEHLDTGLPSHATAAEPWGVFKDWFYHLLRHDYFWEAQRILQSLLHKLSRLECRILVRHYLDKAVATGFDQESVQIAVPSLLERFYFCGVGTPGTKPRVVAEWDEVMALQRLMSSVDL